MPEISEKDMFQVTENKLLMFIWRAGLNSITKIKNKSWLEKTNHTVCNCETRVKISDKACMLLLLRLGKLRLLEQSLSGTMAMFDVSYFINPYNCPLVLFINHFSHERVEVCRLKIKCKWQEEVTSIWVVHWRPKLSAKQVFF